MRRLIPVIGAALLLLTIPSRSFAAFSYAVWLDGQLSDGGNAIPGRLTALGNSVTLVTTSQLETPGFLNAFDAIVVSRYDASFGSFLSAGAAANVAAYVGSGAGQGGVAVFTNDMADNLLGSGSGDPFDANLDALFVNAATFAAKSHHGYIGEFNGSVQAMASNSLGATAMGLLQGSVINASWGSGGTRYGPQFVYDFGPIGASNPIDAGVTFPFTDADNSTYLARITGANPNNVVDVYVDSIVGGGSINGMPAVLANSYVIHGGHEGVPDAASSLMLVVMGLVSLLGVGRRFRQS